MAQDTGIKTKEWMLLVFIAVCTVLVVVIWYQGLTSGREEPAGYVRPTADFEISEDAYEIWNVTQEPSLPTPTPTPGS